MATRTLIFNKFGYDPFIDFLKTYSIICVVTAHILPAELYQFALFQVWGDMQVPFFVLIQVFHAYKKGIRPKLNWMYLLKRIIVPFVAVQAVIIGIKTLTGGGVSFASFVISGGFGPGSYYMWIYLQIAFILLISWPWLNRLSLDQTLIVFFILSIMFEFLFSVFDFPEWLYRLLCIRYLFLIPLGLIWVERGVLLNQKTVLLSLLSIIAVLFFSFTNYDLEPLFFNTGWKTHRWICYFYIPILLTIGLYNIWVELKKSTKMELLNKWVAARSYEIFLAQMAILTFLKPADVTIDQNSLLRFIMYSVLAFALSFICGGILYWIQKSLLFR